MRRLYEVVHEYKTHPGRNGRETEHERWPAYVLEAEEQADRLNWHLALAGKGSTVGTLV